MAAGEIYWKLIEPIWDLVDFYEDYKKFEKTFSKITQKQKDLYAAHWCQSEVNNGGLFQFFDNSTGMVGPEACEGFKNIGLYETHEILEKAIGLFGSEFPRDRELRQSLMTSFLTEELVKLDDKFWDSLENDKFEITADKFAES